MLENQISNKRKRTLRPGYIPSKIDFGMEEFAAYSFDRVKSNYYSRLEDCLSDFSELSVHDIRVALRRLMSFTDMINDILPSVYSEELNKQLSHRIKIFSPLRDTQVQILEIQLLRGKLPHLNIFFYHLLKKEQEYIYKIQKILPQLHSADFDNILKSYENELSGGISSANIHIRQFFNAIDLVYKYCVSKLKMLDPERPETIHSLRLTFKRFRYMVEHTRELNYISEKGFKKFKKYQDMMGAIQDNEVLTRKLEKFFTKYNMLPESEIVKIIDFMKEDGQKKIKIFMENSSGIESLWTVPGNRKQV